jgi:hypothetical protein
VCTMFPVDCHLIKSISRYIVVFVIVANHHLELLHFESGQVTNTSS